MEKVCARCGGSFDSEAFFGRRNGSSVRYAYLTRSICIGCEQSTRDATKGESRWRAKARDALNRHADRFIADGLAVDRADFATRYGWDVGRMAHEAEHAYSNGCGYCGHRFQEMGHGLADITLDILDPTALPFYATNVKWCCATCNREKARTPTAVWGAKLACWAKWRRRQGELRDDPNIGTLFEGTGYSL